MWGFFIRCMRLILFTLFFGLAQLLSAQGYYWQEAKKEQKWRNLTFGLGAGNRMYFGDIQQTGSIFNKINMAYQMEARYQMNPRLGVALQSGGRKYSGYKQFAYPGSYQELSGRLWEGHFVGQFSPLKWIDMNVHKFAGYDPIVRANLYIGAGVGGSIYNASYDLVYNSSSDSTVSVSESKSASGFAMYVPIEVGFRYRFTPRWSMNFEYQYHLYFSDNLDAVNRSANDRMGLLLFKMAYSLGQPKRPVW